METATVQGSADDIPNGDFLPSIRISQIAGVVAVLSALQLGVSLAAAFWSKADLPAGLWLLSHAAGATVLLVSLFMLWRKSS